MTNSTIQPPAASSHITPYGFANIARHFLETERAIDGVYTFSVVPYYLLAHSIELGLKAFILIEGESLDFVKDKLRHNLEKALKKADAMGLSSMIKMEQDEHDALIKANKYYAGKGFEYFQVIQAARGYPDLPELGCLRSFAQRLIDAVQPFCLKNA
jgi:hypothetical protein